MLLMMHFDWLRLRLLWCNIPEAFGVQRGNDRYQNRGDNHAGGNQGGGGGGNRFERRVNLGDDHRVCYRGTRS